MAYEVEHTDTFGGEANYCWVNRYTIPSSDIPDDRVKSRRMLVRRAKALTGLTGVRCEVSDYGDMIRIEPKAWCQVVFVTYREDDDTTEVG